MIWRLRLQVVREGYLCYVFKYVLQIFKGINAINFAGLCYRVDNSRYLSLILLLIGISTGQSGQELVIRC